jgi:hypothetical protein
LTERQRFGWRPAVVGEKLKLPEKQIILDKSSWQEIASDSWKKSGGKWQPARAFP